MNIENPLDIIKRLDVKQNVTIRIIDEPTGKVVQEHVGHNAATHSMLTGIAHYLMGDGVLNQGADTLSTWVPQYISLGTMGLTSQESETITVDGVEYIVPAGIGNTPVPSSGATANELMLNAELRFEEYINQLPGFGADGYDSNTNNNREWFGLGLPYTLRPLPTAQDFYTWDGLATTFTLSNTPVNIVSATIFPDGVIDQNPDHFVAQSTLSSENYRIVSGNQIQLDASVQTLPEGTRLAVLYTYNSSDAVNCELIKSKIDQYNNVVPLTLRSNITYRDMVPEYESQLPSTLDIVYSAFVSVGALAEYRGSRDYIYITEAGLWAKNAYDGSGNNGLLAGYRITPPDVLDIAFQTTFTGDGSTKEFQFKDIVSSIVSVFVDDVELTDGYILDFQTDAIVFTAAPETDAHIVVNYRTPENQDSWKDMDSEANRQKVQQSILRIGENQIAQIVWKLQLGGLEQLGDLRNLYPSQYPEEVWTIV